MSRDGRPNPHVCPKCGTGDVIRFPPRVSTHWLRPEWDRMFVDCTCNGCGYEWVDVYVWERRMFGAPVADLDGNRR